MDRLRGVLPYLPLLALASTGFGASAQTPTTVLPAAFDLALDRLRGGYLVAYEDTERHFGNGLTYHNRGTVAAGGAPSDYRLATADTAGYVAVLRPDSVIAYRRPGGRRVTRVALSGAPGFPRERDRLLRTALTPEALAQTGPWQLDSVYVGVDGAPLARYAALAPTGNTTGADVRLVRTVIVDTDRERIRAIAQAGTRDGELVARVTRTFGTWAPPTTTLSETFALSTAGVDSFDLRPGAPDFTAYVLHAMRQDNSFAEEPPGLKRRILGGVAPALEATPASGDPSLATADVAYFFAHVDCPPCGKTLASLAERDFRIGNRAVVFLSDRDGPERLADYLAFEGYDGRLAAFAIPGQAWRYGVSVSPTLVVLDGGGRVAQVVSGAAGIAGALAE